MLSSRRVRQPDRSSGWAQLRAIISWPSPSDPASSTAFWVTSSPSRDQSESLPSASLFSSSTTQSTITARRHGSAEQQPDAGLLSHDFPFR